MSDWSGSNPFDVPDWIHDGPGNFPWDIWEQRAIEAGLDEELVAIGRSVYREAYNHSWNHDLQAECGWADDGEQMLRQALLQPQAMRARWQYLLATDGERIEPYPEGRSF